MAKLGFFSKIRVDSTVSNLVGDENTFTDDLKKRIRLIGTIIKIKIGSYIYKDLWSKN